MSTNHNSLTKLVFYKISKNDLDSLYIECDKKNMLDEFSVALIIKCLFNKEYYNDIEKYDINYDIIDKSFGEDDTYIDSFDAKNFYLAGLGIDSDIRDAKKKMRNILYSSVVSNNENVLNGLVEAMKRNENISGLVAVEDLLEINHRNNKKVLTKTLK